MFGIFFVMGTGVNARTICLLDIQSAKGSIQCLSLLLIRNPISLLHQSLDPDAHPPLTLLPLSLRERVAVGVHTAHGGISPRVPTTTDILRAQQLDVAVQPSGRHASLFRQLGRPPALLELLQRRLRAGLERLQVRLQR